MRLLGDCLDRVDAEHVPAYLETSSVANQRRYESVGFVRKAQFAMPGDGPTVTTMWRPAM